MTEQIALIKTEYTQDDLGEWVETRTKKTVFSQVDSVTMNEFYQAGLQGFKPDYRFAVWQSEYEGEELIARCFCHELDHLDGIIYTEVMERFLTEEELQFED